MTITTLDPYRSGTGWLYRLDARVKVGFTLFYVVTVALMPSDAWPLLIGLAALILCAVIAAKLTPGFVLIRLIGLLPFVLTALPLIFRVAGPPVVMLPWDWTITRPGLARFGAVVFKASLSYLAVLTLIVVTPFNEILVALRSWRMPKLAVAILALTWRYLFVLEDEARRLLRARAARSGMHARSGIKRLVWEAQITGGLVGNLWMRGMERAERIYAAMAARGYDGDLRTLSHHPLGFRERLALVSGGSVFLVLVLTGLLVWG